MGFCRSYAEADAFLEEKKLMTFKGYDELFNIGELADAVCSAESCARAGWKGSWQSIFDKYYGAVKSDADWTTVEKFIIEAFCALGGVSDGDYDYYSKDPLAYISRWAVEKDYWYVEGMSFFRVTMIMFPKFVDRLEVLLGVKEKNVREYLKYKADEAPQMTQIITKPVGEDLWKFFERGCSDGCDNLVHRGVTLGRLLVGTDAGDVMDIYLMLHAHSMLWYSYGVVDVCLYVENKKLDFNYAYYTTVCYASDAYDYLNMQLREIITEKTGLTYVTDGDRDVCKGLVFPYIRRLFGGDCSEQSEVVNSFARLESDVNAPVYISFTDSVDIRYLVGKAEFNRLGRIGAEKVHSSIGFYGVVPDRYFSMMLEEPSQVCVDVSGYVSDLSKITLLKYDRQATNAQAEASFLGNMGMVTAILRGVEPVGAEAHWLSGSARVHAAHTIKKWEPATTAAFMLKEVPDVRVLKIYVNGSEKVSPVPSRFFVKSESHRWYEYDYSGVKDGYLTPKEIKDFSIRGVADAELLRGGLSFALGTIYGDGSFCDYGVGACIKGVADKLGLKVKFLHHNSYIGMQNDMRCLWRILLCLKDEGKF